MINFMKKSSINSGMWDFKIRIYNVLPSGR